MFSLEFGVSRINIFQVEIGGGWVSAKKFGTKIESLKTLIIVNGPLRHCFMSKKREQQRGGRAEKGERGRAKREEERQRQRQTDRQGRDTGRERQGREADRGESEREREKERKKEKRKKERGNSRVFTRKIYLDGTPGIHVLEPNLECHAEPTAKRVPC